MLSFSLFRSAAAARRCGAMVLLSCLTAGAPTVHAQGTQADYQRAAGLRQKLEGKVVGTVPDITWIDSSRLWYTVDLGQQRRRYTEVDAATGTKSDLFDAAKLAAELQRLTNTAVDPQRLPLERLAVTAETADLLLTGTTRTVRLNRATGELKDVPIEEVPAFLLEGSTLTRKGASTAIIIQNRTDTEAELFWLGGDGRKSYGKVGPGQVRRQHTFGGHRWAIVRADGSTAFEGAAVDQPAVVIVQTKDAPKAEPDGKVAPATKPTDGATANKPAAQPKRARRVLVRDSNLVLAEGGSEKPLTTQGTPEAGYAGPIEWSPDRTRFVARFVTPAQKRPISIIESSPPDQVQPKVHTFNYLKPGDVIEVSKPRLFDAERGVELPLADELFPTPWANDRLKWQADSSGFSFVYNQRGHQIQRLVGVSRDGVARPITTEAPDTFVDYVNSTYLHRIEATGEAIWMSERDGWRHLYLLDERAATPEAALKAQITRGSWIVRGVDRVDEANRQIWFRAGGIHPDQDPYYIHYARVNFDGTGLVLLTEGDGTHTVEYSPDQKYLIDRYSRIDMPGVVELRRTDTGKLVTTLEKADWSPLLSQPWVPPQRFVAPGRDGTTPIYGVIVRPTNFDPSRKYPVVEHIYAGPHSAFVPKAFDPHLGIMQDIAELGFIVVQIDGMGTAHRSKAFHDVCWKNLGDSGFPDRIAWIRAAAAAHRELDLTRVGIFGGSAGGQSSLRAMLAHGDFYSVAVADCGCHDNRMDKIWWNEAWMGWPIGQHYAEQSNVTQAHRLTGKLLLIVGELDRNVDPASTMQVANALIKADKDFDLLVIPGAGHGAAETAYGRRRRADFLVRHLLNVEPRKAP